MTPTEVRVAQVMSRHGCQLAVEKITPATSMVMDACINGIDVYDFVGDLTEEFGVVAEEIPWVRFSDQRASFYGCGCLSFPVWLAGRSIVALMRGEPVIPRVDPELIPKLTVAHIGMVVDQGFWSEPD